ncbi:YhgE/Pip family protein [Amnibacterium sp. CER49]|uniref:YhgE/Pip family protein n=1 Tax=Amnibacterium sp. CER49 TaxID=3039161 RepID=UPI002447AEE8|nr:YhgE/Pip family protein [Amnibacterium sp. CER49]MDH2442905.1 YhgE/Pip family protein [Amnibacterium sp. CER49]
MTRRSFRRIALLLLVAIVPSLVLGVFIGALAAADKGSASVPAAIVNNDRLIQTKGADGKATTIAAGRLVVTNLTKPPASDATGASIEWRLSNASQAKDLLDSGAVYAIVTIPKDFSKSISSVSSTDPQRARISIETDDAHGYIVSQLSSSLGTSLTATLGSTISRSVIEGLYGGFASLRTGIGSAATGADSLGSGAGRLAGGLGRLAGGQDGIASGAASLASGAAQLSSGADSLSAGLDQAATGASDLSSGVQRYTGGVSSLASGLTTAASRSSGLQSYPRLATAYANGVSGASDGLKHVLADPTLPAADRAAIARIQGGLAALAQQNGALTGGAQGAAGLQSGVAQSAAGARTLAANGASLASGAAALPSGLRQSASGASSLAAGATNVASGADSLSAGAARIATGIRSSQAGATKLGDGATSLASGLRKAVAGLPDTTPEQRTRIAQAVSDPVQASAVRRHETTSIGAIVAALIIPVSLWIGAAAAVLLFGALRRRLLPTGIGTSRLVGSALGRGAVLAALQALLLVALMELTLHLDLGTAGLALLVSVVAGIAYFAVHQLLTALFDRAGTVFSIVLLGVQLVAVGGLYPIQLVSAPFQVISPYLPLTAAVSALQAIITGAGGAAVGGGIATLALTGLIAYVLTVAVVARRRTSVALFAPPAAPALG